MSFTVCVERVKKAVIWSLLRLGTLADPNGRKYIAPDGPQAAIIRWAFEELAAGRYNTEQIWKMVKDKGFKATRSLFWFAIRNPVYCGKIFIPKHKDGEAQFVKNQHEPIISESLFYEVQDILDGRGRKYREKAASKSFLPLRGFLLCPVCGKQLTGSTSRGCRNIIPITTAPAAIRTAFAQIMSMIY